MRGTRARANRALPRRGCRRRLRRTGAEGLPGVRVGLPRAPGDSAGVRRRSRELPHDRSQRVTSLQQSRSRHADRYAGGAHHGLRRAPRSQEYHEAVEVSRKPTPEVQRVVEEELTRAFRKIDRAALGFSVGTVGGLALFLATLALVVKGGAVVGPTLALLAQYFPGYTVTPLGSLVGLFYGFISGFVGGWLFAALRNVLTFL